MDRRGIVPGRGSEIVPIGPFI
eukprot:SAG31_NODE_37660_length_302_cov_1.009852_1_plen_21_part_01